MPFSPLDTLPTAPQRTDPPDDFADLADAFVVAMQTFSSQLNTFISELETAAALIAAEPAYADAGLVALTGNTAAADRLPYYTGTSTSALATLTSVARTLLAQSSQANMRTTGLGLSANGSSLVSAADYAAMRELLDLEAGTDFLTPAAIAAAYQPLFGTLDSGPWSPTLTNETNITTSTLAGSGHWMRVGDVVVAGCSIEITPTATGLIEMGISLPVASDFTDSRYAVGSVAAATGAIVGALQSDGTNDRLKLRGNASTTTTAVIPFNFSYRVL